MDKKQPVTLLFKGFSFIRWLPINQFALLMFEDHGTWTDRLLFGSGMVCYWGRRDEPYLGDL